MSYKNKKSKSNKKLFYFVIAVLLLVILAFVVYFQFFKDKNTNNSEDLNAKTTSIAPTAQENFTEGGDREVGEAQDRGEVVVTDNQGSIDNTPDESQWTSSSTGEITLYSPSKNQVLENDSLISGETTLSDVYFRIIDNVSGVISEGKLSVVSGKFSGKVSFSTTATEGRLDIYSTRSDGAEISNIEVPVLFK